MSEELDEKNERYHSEDDGQLSGCSTASAKGEQLTEKLKE